MCSANWTLAAAMRCSRSFPAKAQQLITTTHLDWMSGITPGRVHRVDHGRVSLLDGAGGQGWPVT